MIILIGLNVYVKARVRQILKSVFPQNDALYKDINTESHNVLILEISLKTYKKQLIFLKIKCMIIILIEFKL